MFVGQHALACGLPMYIEESGCGSPFSCKKNSRSVSNGIGWCNDNINITNDSPLVKI